MKIAIVGAGPAGCHLAHLLASTEHEILLFDHRAPYEKPCGGGLSPLVGRRFPDVMALSFPRYCPPYVQLRASDGSQVEQSLGVADWAITSRADLGRALLESALANANVHLVRRAVIDVQQGGDGWQVRTVQGHPYTADFLVGADGVWSIVRKRVVGPIPRRHLSLAVGYRVRGAPDAIIFQTFSDLYGYLWSFPRLNHASVGIGGQLGTVPPRDLWQRVDRFLVDICPGASKDRRWAALLPMGHDPSLWDTPCAGPAWALLGDAAGHVHPLTGEGIAYALWSAELLAEALKQGDSEVYDNLWREAYGHSFIAASEMLQRGGTTQGAYEIFLHLAMTTAMSS